METGGIESHEAVLSANMMAMDQRMSCCCNKIMLCLVIVIRDYVIFMLIGRPGVISGAPGFQLTFCDISLGPPK